MNDQVSNEDVAKSRTRVDTLRAAIAEEKARASAQATSNSNIVRKATLDNEGDALERELAALRAANDPANAAAQMEALTSQMADAATPDVVNTELPPLPPLPDDDGPSADDEN